MQMAECYLRGMEKLSAECRWLNANCVGWKTLNAELLNAERYWPSAEFRWLNANCVGWKTLNAELLNAERYWPNAEC